MDCGNCQNTGFAVGGRIQPADELIVVKDLERKVAPAPLGGGLVHFDTEFEVEQLQGYARVARSHIRSRPCRPRWPPRLVS